MCLLFTYLEIPMNDAIRMKVVNGKEDLLRHFCGFFLIVFASGDNLIKQLTASDTMYASRMSRFSESLAIAEGDNAKKVTLTVP